MIQGLQVTYYEQTASKILAVSHQPERLWNLVDHSPTRSQLLDDYQLTTRLTTEYLPVHILRNLRNSLFQTCNHTMYF